MQTQTNRRQARLASIGSYKMNSATSKDGYYSVFSSSDKNNYIVTTNCGLPLSLSKGHKDLLLTIGVNWQVANCKNVEFFYNGRGKSIRHFLDSCAQ